MAPRATLKVATAQYPIDAVETLLDWQDKVSDWVAQGAATGAELLVFPEYSAIEQAHALGPAVYSDLAATLTATAELAGERVALHVALAKEHGVHILVGSGPLTRADGHHVNAAQLVTPEGTVGEQHKLIMTPFERDWGMVAGETIRVFDTALGRIGITICYDSEFPYLARAMAAAGAELLLVPQCTERVSGNYRVRTGAMSRALENQMAAVTSPTIGDALWSPAVDRNAGAAGIYVPAEHGVSDTGVVVEGSMNVPGWVTGEIDFTRLRRLRSGGEMRNFTDWLEQPGARAAEAAARIEIISL